MHPLQDPPDVSLTVADGVTGTDWLIAGLILLGAVLASVTVRRVGRRLIEKAAGPGFASVVISRLLSLVALLFGLIYALSQLGVAVGPLLGALGLGGLVLALALQSLVENLVSGLIISARRPFTIGDTVEIADGRRGVVVDVDTRAVRLRTIEGVTIYAPNSDVLSSTIVNLTSERLRRSTVVVGLAYDTDLDDALEVLTQAVRSVPGVADDPAATVALEQFGESTIDAHVMYWHESTIPSEVRVRTDVVLAIHHATEAAGITIAFPQVVVWTGTDRPDGGPYRDRSLDEVLREAAPPPALDEPTRNRLRRRRDG